MSDLGPRSIPKSTQLGQSGASVPARGEREAVSRGARAYYVLASLRPYQWTKNLVVLAALIFAERLYHVPSLVSAVWAFLVFCLLSGGVYILNDLIDLERDRRHPVKSQRPLASGRLPVPVAKMAATLVLVLGLSGSLALGARFALTAGGYFGLIVCYSWFLKDVVIVDVLALSFGFVLRAIAGAVAIDVAFSNWLLICTMLLALFLALNKRRHELTLLAGEAAGHRRILGEYSPYLLDQMIAVVTASTVVSYALYTQAPETVVKFGTDRLVWTLPFVLYGIFRYLYLVHKREEGGNPSQVLLNDRPLLLVVGLWAAAVVLIIYHHASPG